MGLYVKEAKGYFTAFSEKKAVHLASNRSQTFESFQVMHSGRVSVKR